MSKAEDRAFEKYPDYRGMDGGYITQRKKRMVYIEGYHQAEKDLSDISWIKEISGVKDMSRAEEEALKAYPPRSIAANYDTINRRKAFEYGYLKAEKDLELAWEDIKEIYFLFKTVKTEWYGHEFSDYGICQEVLKRFKEQKREEV